MNVFGKKKRGVSFLFAVVMCLVLSGCGGASDPSLGARNAANEDKEKINIGYLLTPNPQSVAAHFDFFSEEMNADVEFKSFDSGPASFAALASGSIQFMTVIGNLPVVNAIAKEMPIEVIWALDQYTTGEGLVVKDGSTIRSLEDIKGKKVAVVKGSTSDLAFSTAIREANVPEDSFTVLNMTPPNMVAAWKADNIEAAFTWDPSLSEMKKDGGRMVIHAVDQSAPIWNLAIVNKEWAATHQDEVEGFIRAQARGYEMFETKPDEAYEAMAKWNGISVESAKEQAEGFKFISLEEQLTDAGLGVPGDIQNSMVARGLQMAADESLRQGQSKSMPEDITTYINISYVQAVLEHDK